MSLRRKMQIWWLLQRASWLLFFKRRPEARADYAQVLALDPSNRVARGFLATAYATDGNREMALEHLRILAADQPDNAATHFNIGYLLEESGDVAGAEASFRHAIALDPHIDRAWYGLALVLIKTERLTEALDALKKNTELQPMSPYGWYQMAMTHHHLGNRAEAMKIRTHLSGFEPKFAAQLARDLGMPGVNGQGG
jgi:predicted Zn-dependent protease